MMNRRSFLKTVGMSLPALAALRGNTSSAMELTKEPESQTPKNWVWVPIKTDRPVDDWKRMFARMRESGVNAILPEIYDGRNAYFASQRLPVKTDLLGTVLSLALAEGLEVHAWMWSMPCMVQRECQGRIGRG
jgi:hypothetical protein